DVPDEPASEPHALETVRELAQDQVSLATGSASALVKFAQADAERARDEMELVREESHRIRKGARIAWSSVALMAATVCVAVGWVSFKMTHATDAISTMNNWIESSQQEKQKLIAERDGSLKQLQAARIAEAQSSAKL